MTEKCPTCGSEVLVQSSDEGTSFYEPISDCHRYKKAYELVRNDLLERGKDYLELLKKFNAAVVMLVAHTNSDKKVVLEAIEKMASNLEGK